MNIIRALRLLCLECVARTYRYLRALSYSSTRSLVALRVVPLVYALVTFITGRNKLTLLGTPIVMGIGVAFARFSRVKSHVRQDGTNVENDEELERLDMGYRNPRWGAFQRTAVRPVEGYSELDAVDGTAGLFAARGHGRVPKLRPATSVGVWLMPFAAYHVEELGPVVAELRSRGVSADLVFAEDPSPAQALIAGRYVDSVGVLAPSQDRFPSAVLTMMDWGPAEKILARARQRGSVIVAKVEGAQDFRNVDTLRMVVPYSRSDLVLAQGEFDAVNVMSENVEVVGSTRMERLYRAGVRGTLEVPQWGPLINLNFSYGTYEALSRLWYEAARIGAARSGMRPRTSVHPAVSAPYVRSKSTWPLSLDLEISSHLITRCSTALIDSLLMGRPVVYFNPHRERVWKSLPWSREVPQARTPRQLAQAIEGLHHSHDASSARTDFALRAFLSVDPTISAASRIAEAVIAARRGAPNLNRLRG